MTTFFKQFLKIMRYVMPLFYLVIGLLLTLTQFLGEETGKFRLGLGILLIVYSVFRAWRIMKDPVNSEQNEPSSDY
jgi:small-conductance mechanosensitive channel